MKIEKFNSGGKVGTEIHDITAPAGTMYRIIYGNVRVNTDSTSASRWVRVGVIEPEGRNILCLCAGAAVTSSKSDQRHSYIQGIYRETSFINNVIQVPLAEELLLPPDYTLRTYLDNGVAGDSFSCDWLVEKINGY